MSAMTGREQRQVATATATLLARQAVDREAIRRGRRRRLIGTASLCGMATTLWIAPSAVLPYADVSVLTVFCGVTIPAGVAGLMWALKRKDADDLDTRTSHTVQAEPVRRGVEGVRR